jgi:hypothetical protein
MLLHEFVNSVESKEGRNSLEVFKAQWHHVAYFLSSIKGGLICGSPFGLSRSLVPVSYAVL